MGKSRAFRVLLTLALIGGFSTAGTTMAVIVAPASALDALCSDLPEACPPLDETIDEAVDDATGENVIPEPVQSPPPSQDTGGSEPSPAPSQPPAEQAPEESGNAAPAAPPPGGGEAAPPSSQPSSGSAPSGGAPLSGSAGSGSSGGSAESSGRPAAGGGSSASSSSSSDAPVPPAVPIAPQGPVLTGVEVRAATRALEEARETLPTSVEPNTRLLAGNTSSSGPLIPSPDDAGLLALIVAMAVASIGCAVSAGLLRNRSRPRHVARS